jgi:hypothetical protein
MEFLDENVGQIFMDEIIFSSTLKHFKGFVQFDK